MSKPPSCSCRCGPPVPIPVGVPLWRLTDVVGPQAAARGNESEDEWELVGDIDWGMKINWFRFPRIQQPNGRWFYTGYIKPFRWRVSWSDAKVALGLIGDANSPISAAATNFNSHIALRENMLPPSSHMHESVLTGLGITKPIFATNIFSTVNYHYTGVAFRIWKNGIDITGIRDTNNQRIHLIPFNLMFDGGSLTDAYIEFDLWIKVEAENPENTSLYSDIFAMITSNVNPDQHQRSTLIYNGNWNTKNLDLAKWRFTPSVKTGLLAGRDSIDMETKDGWTYFTRGPGISRRGVQHNMTSNTLTLNYGREEVLLTVIDTIFYPKPPRGEDYIVEVRYVPIANSTYQPTQSMIGQIREYGTWNPNGSTIFVRDAYTSSVGDSLVYYWNPVALGSLPMELDAYPPFITVTRV